MQVSNFTRPTKNPETGRIEVATFLDDYFGRHQYGIEFPDGSIYRESEIDDEPARPEKD